MISQCLCWCAQQVPARMAQAATLETNVADSRPHVALTLPQWPHRPTLAEGQVRLPAAAARGPRPSSVEEEERRARRRVLRAEVPKAPSNPLTVQAGFVELPEAPRQPEQMDAATLLSRLPRERWSYKYIQEEDAGEGDAECCVCLVEYSPGDIIARLPCTHYAHEACLETSIVRCPKCPVCWKGVRDVGAEACK